MRINCSQYVSLGHPDKVADYISQYILDRYIEKDSYTRYALQVQIKDNFVTLGGEITSKYNFSKEELELFVKEAIKQIGYTAAYQKRWGKQNTISCEDIIVQQHISQQSNDIAIGVANGWGDQGIMFGLAINSPQTDYMPKDIYLARKIGKHLFDSKYAGLDIKTQVTLYNNEVKEVIVAIPMLYKHNKTDIQNIVKYIIGKNKNYNIIINGTGRYVKHASMGDCGTTGRKLAVDFYGGNCNVGGGSPWTKDGSKADLTLNLYARKIALDYIKSTGAPYCKCGISCCIGKKQIQIFLLDENNNIIQTYKQEKLPEQLIKMFNLRKPIFADLCRNGLFYEADL